MFYGPMPATGGIAKYDSSLSVLTVTVFGEVQDFCSGFTLQVVNAENLVYQIFGWAGPVGTGFSPYTHTQSFNTTVPAGQPHHSVTVIRTNGAPLTFPIEIGSTQQQQQQQHSPSPKSAALNNPFNSSVPVAASTLKAVYPLGGGKLYLHAAGQVGYGVSNIRFVRDEYFAGGFRFFLEGSVPMGILPVGSQVPYTIVNDFEIELPNRVAPSNTVVISTQTGEKVIDIEYVPHNGTTAPQALGAGSSFQVNGQTYQELAPAYQLSAEYDPSKQQMTLHASGIKPNTMENIVFERVDWMGGLKFKLVGNQYGSPTFWPPYRQDQTFNNIPIPSQGFTNVIIETAGPKTNVVPVHWITIPNQTATQSQAQVSASQVSPRAQSTAPNGVVSNSVPSNGVSSTKDGDEKLNVLYKMPFEITWNCHVPQKGTVDISFDSNYLQLQSASIRGNQIVWTLDSTNMGNTEITVKETGGIAQYITERTWDVFIHLPGIGMPNPTADVTQQQSNATRQQQPKAATQQQYEPSFVSLVTQGLDLIKARYPGAGLLTADVETNPWGLLHRPVMKVTAEVVVNKKTQIATVINEIALFSTWGNIVLSDPPAIVENVVMKWPVQMDLDEATQLIKNAGYNQTIREVNLRQPFQLVIGPQPSEPLYIFTLAVGPEGEMVIVGVNTKKVTGQTIDNSVNNITQSKANGVKNKYKPSIGVRASPAIAAH